MKLRALTKETRNETNTCHARRLENDKRQLRIRLEMKPAEEVPASSVAVIPNDSRQIKWKLIIMERMQFAMLFINLFTFKFYVALSSRCRNIRFTLAIQSCSGFFSFLNQKSSFRTKKKWKKFQSLLPEMLQINRKKWSKTKKNAQKSDSFRFEIRKTWRRKNAHTHRQTDICE